MKLNSLVNKLFAVAVMLGIGTAAHVKKAQAEPKCTGTGTTCAFASDGTEYYKGEGY